MNIGDDVITLNIPPHDDKDYIIVDMDEEDILRFSLVDYEIPAEPQVQENQPTLKIVK